MMLQIIFHIGFLNICVIIYHLYFWESVKGHWSLSIASNSDHIIAKAIIDCYQQLELGNLPTLFSYNGHIKIYCLLWLLSYTCRFTSAFMHAESIHLAKKHATTTPEIILSFLVPYHLSVALIYKKGVTFILNE